MALESRAVDYCEVAGCDREALCSRDDLALCEAHYQRAYRGLRLAAPVAEKLTPRQRLIEAALALGNADMEDDTAYAALERALVRTAAEVAARAAADAARLRGVVLGRPAVVTAAEASAAVREHGTITAAALAIGVSRRSVRRALLRKARQRAKGHSARLSKARRG